MPMVVHLLGLYFVIVCERSSVSRLPEPGPHVAVHMHLRVYDLPW